MFFFSVETLATVGYGDMHPQSLFAHILAATEIFIGMMSVGLIAGVMFSRFSRPIARFVFADHVVIRPFDGQPTLMLRAANARQNVIMEAQAQLRLIKEELTVESSPIRRIYDLPLRRSQHLHIRLDIAARHRRLEPTAWRVASVIGAGACQPAADSQRHR